MHLGGLLLSKEEHGLLSTLLDNLQSKVVEDVAEVEASERALDDGQLSERAEVLLRNLLLGLPLLKQADQLDVHFLKFDVQLLQSLV